jgi:dihydrofolate reductase
MNIDNEIIIIGGGHIFNETAKFINKLVITRVDCEIEGDIYYPKIDLTKWKLIKTESYIKDSNNDYDFKIEEYMKL